MRAIRCSYLVVAPSPVLLRFCASVGSELAKLTEVHLVVGGFQLFVVPPGLWVFFYGR